MTTAGLLPGRASLGTASEAPRMSNDSAPGSRPETADDLAAHDGGLTGAPRRPLAAERELVALGYEIPAGMSDWGREIFVATQRKLLGLGPPVLTKREQRQSARTQRAIKDLSARIVEFANRNPHLSDAEILRGPRCSSPPRCVPRSTARTPRARRRTSTVRARAPAEPGEPEPPLARPLANLRARIANAIARWASG